MNKNLSAPLVFFAIAIIATTGFVFSKHNSSPAAPSAAERPMHRERAKGNRFEDDSVAFTYYDPFTVRTGETQKQNRKFWVAEDPDDPMKFNEIVISEYPRKKETRSLEQIYQSTDWEAKQIYPPKPLQIDGGRCLSYRLDYAVDDNRVDADGRNRTVSTCTRVEHQAHCYADDGRYFELHSLNGGFCNRQNPDENTVAKIKAYEALIRSLRIKPVS